MEAKVESADELISRCGFADAADAGQGSELLVKVDGTDPALRANTLKGLWAVGLRENGDDFALDGRGLGDGLDAAEARLVESDGTPVALIRRFDRPPGGGRLMYVSAATMLGAEPGDPGEHAYTELVDALRQNGAAPPADIEELWRRIAFSILITNVDDHLLNHGFLHVERGLWRLAPAFDINPFPERVRELKT